MFSHSSYFPPGSYPPTYFPGGRSVPVEEPGVGRRQEPEFLPRLLDVDIWVWLEPAHSQAVCAVSHHQGISIAVFPARSHVAVAIDQALEHIGARVEGRLSLGATITVDVKAMKQRRAVRARDEATENAFLLGVSRRDA